MNVRHELAGKETITGKPTFYPALDGMRAIAVAMVMLVHYFPEIVPWGWTGVQIFFVLSGFLITGILFDTRHDAYRFRNFYVRRALRIFPLYYGFLALCCIALVLLRGRAMPFFWLWFLDLQNFFWMAAHGASDMLVRANGKNITAIGHLWTLAVEEQFYFLWPLLVFGLKDRRRLMQVCCALIAFRLGLAVYWQMHLSAAMLAAGVPYRMLPTQWDSFLIGGLIALWLRGTPSPRLQLYAGRMAILAILLCGGTLTLLHFVPALIGGEDVFDYRSGFMVVAGLPLINVASGALILAALRPGTWVYAVCNQRALRSVGRVSYGLYVFHLPMFVACVMIVGYTCAHLHLLYLQREASALATVASVAVSYASFYYFEQPFLKLKRRFMGSRTLEANP